MSELKLNDRCLMVFIDETGDDRLHDPNFPVFGLGGCAVLMQYYNRFLVEPWKQMKESYFGNKDCRLHASELGVATETQKQAIGDFFRSNLFSRFAVTITLNTFIPLTIHNYHLVASVLRKRIELIANTHPLDSMCIIIESSKRGNKMARRYMSDIKLLDGNKEELLMHKHSMPKSTGEAGLEVADFIINAAGGQSQQDMKKGAKRFRKDYESVFRSVPQQLVHTFDISVVDLIDKKSD